MLKIQNLPPVTKYILKNIYNNMVFMFNSHAIEYEYNNIGADSTLLLLHGWGGNKDSFAKLKKVFKTRYNILSISLPPYDDTLIELNMYTYKSIVLNLLKALNIDKLIIVCHSFGFRVSLMLATTDLKIEKMVITGGAGIRIKPHFLKKLANQFRLIFLKSHPECFNSFASSDYISLSNINRKTFKNIVNKDLTDYIKLLRCPILLFWGSKDNATPIKMFNIIKKLQPQAQSKVINASHFAYLEHSELFVDCCEKFLKGLKI